MKPTEYCVGIVVPQCGLSDNQIADLGARLKYIRQYVGAEGEFNVVVPAVDLAKPNVLPPQVVNVLQYRTQFELRELPPYRPALGGSVGAFLLEQLKACDEVWCCTGPRQGALSQARPADLYRRAQEMGNLAAARFKLVPAWVMRAAAQADAKRTKRKELKWKDVF
ncbi:hypothetical protein D3C87_1018400 [compost metagenome]